MPGTVGMNGATGSTRPRPDAATCSSGPVKCSAQHSRGSRSRNHGRELMR
ncbi:hypothetical protein [Streptomyces sp. E-15]